MKLDDDLSLEEIRGTYETQGKYDRIANYFYPELVHRYIDILPSEFLEFTSEDMEDILDTIRESIPDFPAEPPTASSIIAFIEQKVKTQAKKVGKKQISEKFESTANRSNISTITQYIHFPSIFERILSSPNVSEPEKKNLEIILRKQQPLIGEFLYSRMPRPVYLLQKENVRYGGLRITIRRELDKFFKKYPDLIGLVRIEDDYLPFKAFTFSLEDRKQIIATGIDSSLIQPWKGEAEHPAYPRYPVPLIKIIKVPSLKDTRKRELRRAGYPLGIYIVPKEGSQNLDSYILSQYHTEEKLYIPNKLFWEDLDFIEEGKEAHLYTRIRDSITLKVVRNGIITIPAERELEKLNEICENNRKGRKTFTKRINAREEKEMKNLIDSLTSNYITSFIEEKSSIPVGISRKMLFEFREVFNYQDLRVGRYLLYQKELIDRIGKRKEVFKKYKIKSISNVSNELKETIIKEVDGIIPLNKETFPLYKVKHSDFTEYTLILFKVHPEVFIHFHTVQEITLMMREILKSLDRHDDVDLRKYVPIGIEYDIVAMESLLRKYVKNSGDPINDYIQRGILLQLALSSRFYGNIFDPEWVYWKYSNEQGKEIQATMTTRERIGQILKISLKRFSKSFLSILTTHSRIFLHESLPVVSLDKIVPGEGLKLRLKNVIMLKTPFEDEQPLPTPSEPLPVPEPPSNIPPQVIPMDRELPLFL